MVVIVLDVIVVWRLFESFEPTHQGLSRPAAWLRISYAAVFAVASSHLATALHLLGGDGYLRTLDMGQLQTGALLEIGGFHDVWDIALVLFGLHLVLIGDPSWTSQSVPRVIGVLLAMAGLGYLVDSIDAMAVADYSLTVGAVTFVGEVVFVVWLLVRGGRTSTSPRR